jgi:hypothetical protein
MKKIILIILLVIIISSSILAVDTLHCIANYEFQTPMEENEFMSIRALGDVNADGYDDWAYIFYDRNTYYTNDTTWVFFGSDTIDFTQDFTLKAHDIASIGDVNNDGFTDIAYLNIKVENRYIIGTPQLYILHGGPDFDFIPDDTCDVKAGGNSPYFSPIGTLGDINGDGYDDVYSGVYYQINTTGRAKQYIHFGGQNISKDADIILNPPTRIDTVVLGEYRWGWRFASMGDLDADGFDDFSIIYSDVQYWSEENRVVYLYKGASTVDSIISSVDTLISDFYTDMTDVSNYDGNDNTALFMYNPLKYIDVYSPNYSIPIFRYNNVLETCENNGDINNDGFNDWFIHFEDPTFYQGYYGGFEFDTISDITFPADEQPDIHSNSRLKSAYVGDICGDGFDKLLLIKSSGSYPSGSSNKYHVYCYSFNEVLTGTASLKPNSYTLSQNYPNPLNPSTSISYNLPEAQNITLQVFDITGRLVETLYSGYKDAGKWNIVWNATNQSSGIYIYRLTYGNKQISRKMVVMK